MVSVCQLAHKVLLCTVSVYTCCIFLWVHAVFMDEQSFNIALVKFHVHVHVYYAQNIILVCGASLSAKTVSRLML